MYTILFDSDQQFLIKILETLTLLTEIYDVLGLVLYLTIGLLIATHFRYLRFNIENYSYSIICDANRHSALSDMTKINDKSNFLLRLKKWRHTYTKLLHIVHLFQICFDSTLFIWIVYIFISFINNSFYLVNRPTHFGVLNLVVYIIRIVVDIHVLTLVPIIIHREVCARIKRISWFSSPTFWYISETLLQCASIANPLRKLHCVFYNNPAKRKVTWIFDSIHFKKLNLDLFVLFVFFSCRCFFSKFYKIPSL